MILSLPQGAHPARRLLPVFLLLCPLVASAQPGPAPEIITEQNGRITSYRAEGSLAPSQAPGCIPLAEAKNSYTPPDLYLGVGECITREQYEQAAGLFALAGIYARFDAERVTDKSAGQARTVLIMNTFAAQPQEKKARFKASLDRITKTPDLLAGLCGEVQKVGAPDYYPKYMILHGIKAFTGNPHDGALQPDFDARKVWMKLQTEYLHCPS